MGPWLMLRLNRPGSVSGCTTFASDSTAAQDWAKPSTLNDQGWVSSACFSPTLGGHIALAFLKSGRERYGEKIVVWDKLRGVETVAEVCDPVFVDPENRKLMA